MNRRTILAAVALTTLGGLALSLPASAHHDTITCVAPGVVDVANSEPISQTFTTDDPADSPHTGTIGGHGHVQIAYTGSEITVNGVWSNGFTNTVTFTGVCLDVTTTTVAPTTLAPTTTVAPTTTEATTSTTTTLPDETTTTVTPTTQETTTTLPVTTSSTTDVSTSTTSSLPDESSTTSSPPTTSPTTSSSVAATSTTSLPSASTTIATTTVPPSSLPPAPSSTTPERCDAPPGTESDAGCVLPPPMLPATR